MDDIWKLIYGDFESGLHGAWKTAVASSAMRNDVQFRLQKAIAEYKTNPSDKTMEEIRADIMLAQTLGFVTAETAEKAQSILDKMV